MPSQPSKPPDWRKSAAKKALKKGLHDGVYPTSMTPEAVYQSEEQFRKWPFKKFEGYLATLRAAIARHGNRALDDNADFYDDLLRNPPIATTARGYPIWKDSAAERFLVEDVNSGRHLTMKPKELRQTREEYMEFPLDVFRDHIEQETRSRLGRSYWQARTKKTKAEKAKEPWPTIESL